MKPEESKRPVRVHLLNGESMLLVYDPKAYVKEVFQRVCAFCSIEETQFFGLTLANEKEAYFLELNQRLSKYAPKGWSKPSRRASLKSLKLAAVFELNFQVQFFVEHPRLVRDVNSRHHYFLQMKRNVLLSDHRVSDEIIFTLAACSLHIECGNFDVKLHVGSYFNPHEHVPQWFIQKWKESFIIANLPPAHRDLLNTSAYAAQGDYIKTALCIDDAPVHNYKLFKTKNEVNPSVIMGIHHKGVRFIHTNPDARLYLNYDWNRIGRLSFKKKRFEIFPSEVDRVHRLIYYTSSNEISEYFLRSLKDAHSIYMSLTPFMEHIRKSLAKAARPDFRISYIYGIDPNGTEREVRVQNLERSGISLRDVNNLEDMKISRGSSHTSGIESDSKVRVEDEVVSAAVEVNSERSLAKSINLAPGSLLRSESSDNFESNKRLNTQSSSSGEVFIADENSRLPPPPIVSAPIERSQDDSGDLSDNRDDRKEEVEPKPEVESEEAEEREEADGRSSPIENGEMTNEVADDDAADSVNEPSTESAVQHPDPVINSMEHSKESPEDPNESPEDSFFLPSSSLRTKRAPILSNQPLSMSSYNTGGISSTTYDSSDDDDDSIDDLNEEVTYIVNNDFETEVDGVLETTDDVIRENGSASDEKPEPLDDTKEESDAVRKSFTQSRSSLTESASESKIENIVTSLDDSTVSESQVTSAADFEPSNLRTMQSCDDLRDDSAALVITSRRKASTESTANSSVDLTATSRSSAPRHRRHSKSRMSLNGSTRSERKRRSVYSRRSMVIDYDQLEEFMV